MPVRRGQGHVVPLEPPTQTKIKIHVFVTEKGDYYEIADGLPQAATVPSRPQSG